MTIKTSITNYSIKEISINDYEINFIKEINNKIGELHTIRIIRWKYDCSIKQALDIYNRATA